LSPSSSQYDTLPWAVITNWHHEARYTPAVVSPPSVIFRLFPTFTHYRIIIERTKMLTLISTKATQFGVTEAGSSLCDHRPTWGTSDFICRDNLTAASIVQVPRSLSAASSFQTSTVDYIPTRGARGTSTRQSPHAIKICCQGNCSRRSPYMRSSFMTTCLFCMRLAPQPDSSCKSGTYCNVSQWLLFGGGMIEAKASRPDIVRQSPFLSTRLHLRHMMLCAIQ
jgi:hypothetical protein